MTRSWMCQCPKEHISEWKFVEAFDVPAPQIQEEIVEVSLLSPQERTSERTVEQIMDVSVPVPQIQEQILEVANVIPQERISERIIEQAHDVPVPQIQEQIPEVAEIIPQRRISERIVEHTRDVPVPQIREHVVEVVKNIPRSASRSVLPNRLSMYRCLRSTNKLWKSRRSLRRSASRNVLNRLSMSQCLRSWKRSSRR